MLQTDWQLHTKLCESLGKCSVERCSIIGEQIHKFREAFIVDERHICRQHHELARGICVLLISLAVDNLCPFLVFQKFEVGVCK